MYTYSHNKTCRNRSSGNGSRFVIPVDSGRFQHEIPGTETNPLSIMQESAHGPSSGAGINLDSIFSSPKENWSELAFAGKKSS